LQMIPDLTDIPLALGLNQIPIRVEEYMSLMGKIIEWLCWPKGPSL